MPNPLSHVEEPVAPQRSQRSALGWLFSRARPAGGWIALSAGLGLAGGFLTVAQAALLSRIFHRAAIDRVAIQALFPLFAMAVVVVLTRSAAAWVREEAAFSAGVRVREQTRAELLDRLLGLGPAAGKSGGALSAAVLERVEALHGFYARYLPQLFVAATVPGAIVGFVFPVSWAAAGLLLLTAPLIPLFMVLVGMGAESVSQKHFEALARLGTRFLDVLQGIETLKRFGRSRGRAADIRGSSEQYRRRTMAVLRVAFLSSAVLEFFASISIALVAVYLGLTYLGYLDFGLYGRALTLENGLFILLLAPEFYAPLRELGASYHARAEAVGAAGELCRLLAGPSTAAGEATPAPAPPGTPDRIRFEGVFFSYEGEREPVLRGVDMELTRGRRTFLVGGSGEGKTTVLHLLMRFYSPSAGQILADGRSIFDLPPEVWRSRVAWIGQDPGLLSGTLGENIRLGRPEASEEEVKAAAAAARVDEFARHLPGGYQGQVGEGGRLLSRGQAQRVAIARAVLADSPVLLLDEPLAGLDAETESVVSAALEALCRRRTVLWVTHRLDAAGPADRVLVLADGKIREASFEERHPFSTERGK